jgi:hypothetical protein
MRLTFSIFYLITLVAGCQPSSVPPPSYLTSESPLRRPSSFDMSKAVDFRGRVIWVGPKPVAAPIQGLLRVGETIENREFENPNVLRLSGDSDRVFGAVVFLEDVDPQNSCPWFHAPLQVRVDDTHIRTYQGRYLEHTRIGIVRERTTVEFVATDHGSHVVSLRGADFFGMSLPEVGVPRRHRFDERGLVELSSGANRPWHRAYLWVTPHPYFALTNDQGEFELKMVPCGEYRIRAWHPNSEILSYDRDPNTGQITRIHFGPAFSSSRPIQVRPEMDPVVLTLSK